jgi:hypothetical protein
VMRWFGFPLPLFGASAGATNAAVLVSGFI